MSDDVRLKINGVEVYPAAPGGGTTMDFTAAVKAAWDGDYVLDWRGGNVALSSPIVLSAPPSKFGFGIRGNGARVVCAFSGTQYPITVAIPPVNGVVPPNINIRNLDISDLSFSGTGHAGAVKLECLSNNSWIYAFLLNRLRCEGHTGRAFALVGSVFEGVLDRLTTTGGVSGLWIERRGPTGAASDPDMGLPSALYLYSPNFRDGSGNAVELACPQQYQEPFDLTVRDGYIVTCGGKGIVAPSGITCVDGTGFENLRGGCAVQLGYRGGLIKGVRGANAVKDSTPTYGMKYLVDCALSNNRLVLEDCSIQNENAGTGAKLGRISGTGVVNLNRSGLSTGLDGSGPSVVVQTP